MDRAAWKLAIHVPEPLVGLRDFMGFTSSLLGTGFVVSCCFLTMVNKTLDF
jgi:hypothetical protein